MERVFFKKNFSFVGKVIGKEFVEGEGMGSSLEFEEKEERK